MSCVSGGLENSRSSVIGLFRRDSAASAHFNSSCESSPCKERRNSSGGPNAVLVIEEGEGPDPLGVFQRSASTSSGPQPVAPATPKQWRLQQMRRGSMLELSGCVVDDDSGHSQNSAQATHVRRFYFVFLFSLSYLFLQNGARTALCRGLWFSCWEKHKWTDLCFVSYLWVGKRSVASLRRLMHE